MEERDHTSAPMGKKQRIVQLHIILHRIRHLLTETGVAMEGDFASYDELGVSPMRIDMRRGDHEKAVETLVGCLEHSVHSHGPEQTLARSDIHVKRASR